MHTEFYTSLHAPEAGNLAESIHSLRQQFQPELAPLLLRFFCSDVYNQAPLIEKLWPAEPGVQRIYIGQQPLDSAYISLQAYCLAGAMAKQSDGNNALWLRHGAYESLWLLEYPLLRADSAHQTTQVIKAAQARLDHYGMALNGDMLRTWYYLRDVDNNYDGMIQSRLCWYEANGLNAHTHSLASTGIEGRSPDPHALVALHAHAVKGLQPEQVVYLKALDHLSPTYQYGVNFERATKVIYGDRVHCHISGTASIDKNGDVLHKTDVVRQTERALENIAALLAEGDMAIADMLAATVYLRDPQDYAHVASVVSQILPANCAINFTCGPVCRPDWLVEIEGEAVALRKSNYPDFAWQPSPKFRSNA